MKVWELEVGKVYKSDKSKDVLYKRGSDGLIEYKFIGEPWMYSERSYNNLIKTNFTEYEESVDWSKVEVDTKILVRDYNSTSWTKRYFAKFKNGFVCAFQDGRTSFLNHDSYLHSWNYAKLYKETDDEK